MTFVLVVASSYRQCEMVCRKLKLPPPNRTSEGVTTIYAGPKDGPRLAGLLPDRLVIVEPILVGGLDLIRLHDVRVVARHRFARRNAQTVEPREIEYVTT